MQTDDTLIKIEHVDFYYNKGKDIENHVLKDINLEIKKGEYASFLGTSGSGKSTLLYVVSGVDKPTTGKVFINNQDLMSFDQKQAAQFRQNGIGFVFQNFNLIPSLNVVDNVALPMTFMGVPHSQRKERALMLLKKLEIEHLAYRFPFELSGGQQQRVGIARALSNDPPIILADEPIGNLDTANATIVLDILKDINRNEGKTVVIVTHEPWSLRDVTKVFKIKDGAIVDIEEKKSSGATTHRPQDRSLSVEAQAKMLTEFLFSGHTHQEIMRAEEFIALRLAGKLTSPVLRDKLDASFKNFGVGLWKQKAVRISEQIELFLQEKKHIVSLLRHPLHTTDSETHYKLQKITQWLLEDIQGRVSDHIFEKVVSFVASRVSGDFSRDDFIAHLDENPSHGGAGLHIQSAIRISERLDILLGESFSVPVS